MKKYDFGNIKASIERTSSGYFKVCVDYDGHHFESMFSTEVSALYEILSYCETDSDDDE